LRRGDAPGLPPLVIPFAVTVITKRSGHRCSISRESSNLAIPGMSCPGFSLPAMSRAAALPTRDCLGLPSFVTLPPMLPSPHNKNGFPGLGRWTPEPEDPR
jgi:hypothetical protein